VTSYYIY